MIQIADWIFAGCNRSVTLQRGTASKGDHMWLLWMIFVGLIAGWATGKIMKGSGYGPLMDVVIGITGSFIGGGIIDMFGFYNSGGLVPSILVAILGASVLVAFVRILKRV